MGLHEAGLPSHRSADLDPGAYRPFNLVLADNTSAWWLAAREGAHAIVVERIAEGLSMLTAHDMNDPASSRITRYLPQFRAAAEPDPEAGDWGEWQALLAARDTDDDYFGAMNIVTDAGFGTLSSSLIALPSTQAPDPRGRWLFSKGRPGDVEYEAVES